MPVGPLTAERMQTALGGVLDAQVEKILERAAADQATPDKDLRGLGVKSTRPQMVRAMLINLKSAYAEVAAAIEEVFGAAG